MIELYINERSPGKTSHMLSLMANMIRSNIPFFIPNRKLKRKIEEYMNADFLHVEINDSYIDTNTSFYTDNHGDLAGITYGDKKEKKEGLIVSPGCYVLKEHFDYEKEKGKREDSFLFQPGNIIAMDVACFAQDVSTGNRTRIKDYWLRVYCKVGVEGFNASNGDDFSISLNGVLEKLPKKDEVRIIGHYKWKNK